MQKKLLTNVAIIRIILIVLLVFYHAFAIYGGAWQSIEGYPEIEAYWWLDKLSYAFMLESFVFVSGYVFGYQVKVKGETKLETKSLLIGKIKRLIIPGMVFSLLYIVLFQDISQPIGKTIYDLFNGVGHLWFLPMLFWCFVAILLIEKMHLRSGFVIPILLICSICSFVQLPFRLNTSMYYMLFFYVGYIFQRKDVNIEKYYKPGYAIFLTLGFLVLFILITYCEKSGLFLNVEGKFWSNWMIKTIIKYILILTPRLIYASAGLALLMVVVGLLEKNRIKTLPNWIIMVGGLCMGVYLLQQFILNGLYYFTTLSLVTAPYWLPWIGFIITLVCSLVLSHTLRLTKLGRFLIG